MSANTAADDATRGETGTPPSAPSTKQKNPLNAPGIWRGPYISHTRGNGHGVAVSEGVYHEMNVRDLSSWQDVRMDDRSEQAREEGVKNSSCCVAVVTGPCVNPDRPNDKKEDNAYFNRPLRLQELRWAKEADKLIVCLVRMEDKNKVNLFFEDAPADFRHLRNGVIFYDRNDPDYQKIGIRKLLVATGLRPEGFGSVPVVQSDTPPKPKHDGGSHWMIACNLADDRGASLADAVARSMRQRDYFLHDSDVTKSDALLVILTDNVFTESICRLIHSARSCAIPVVCAVDKTRLRALSLKPPDDLKSLVDAEIFHLEMDDKDYLECGVTKILRASGHVMREDADNEMASLASMSSRALLRRPPSPDSPQHRNKQKEDVTWALAANGTTQGGETETPPPSTPITPINAPGFWKGPFISHTRRSGDGVAVSERVYHEMYVRGLPPWQACHVTTPSFEGMEEGVKNSSCCVAVVTGPCANDDFSDKPEDNAYFNRPG